ncbi:MAG TPA: hypothetical protein DIS78_01265 [Lachnospiraceae bacterium]|nr:hypothetical protein [Lachnospiraceae bacterium]
MKLSRYIYQGDTEPSPVSILDTVKLADECMYHSKQNGKNSVSYKDGEKMCQVSKDSNDR